MCCLTPVFRKAKFDDVPTRAIVKVGCAVGKKKGCRTGND
jgi:hypothetical protein